MDTHFPTVSCVPLGSGFGFLIYKMGVTIVPTSTGCYDD